MAERPPQKFASTVDMPPSEPAPSAQGDFLHTVAMSPDGMPPDEVQLARAQLDEAARVEAMMKAPRVHGGPPPKKRNGFFVAAIVLVVIAVGLAAFYIVRRETAVKAPVTLPAAASH